MELIKENITKNIDNLGRITIPKAIRNRLDLNPGTEMEFFRLSMDGKQYVALSSTTETPVYKYQFVKQVFEDYGLEVPKELIDKIMEEQANAAAL